MSLADETDEALGLWVASNAPQGSAHAPFQELYRRHAMMIERFIAGRISVSQVADIHQKTWVKAWDRANQFAVGTGYRAWLLTIARNTITDEYRSTARKPVLALADENYVVSCEEPVVESLIADEESEALANCLGKLDPKAVDLVRGRLGGKKYVELCAALDLTESAAHKLFFRSKDQLQQCLEAKLL